MARVVNELIDVVLAGPARVKQYSGTGPLMVKLPGDRGEVRAASGDYVLYEGDSVVGVVGSDYLDALREDKDTLVEEEVATGAHLEATVLDNAGVALPSTVVTLSQAGATIAEGRTDADGLVTFNVLPGIYQIQPKDKTKGPEMTVEAALEVVAPPDPPITRKGGPVRPGGPLAPPKPDQGLPRPPLGSVGGGAGLPHPSHPIAPTPAPTPHTSNPEPESKK
jgi:hypothetical protein